jgi:Glycosyltransferase
MKILVVSQYYNPERFLINEIAPELVRRGHSVTVLTGLPNYPDGVIPDEYRHGRRHETIDGVEVIRCPNIARGKGKLGLILNYASYAISASHKINKLSNDYDVILCYQLSPVTMAFPALKYRKKHGIPLLLYCLDLWPESAQAHVKNDRGLLYKFISALSRRVYRSCDLIAVTSEPFIEYLKNKTCVAPQKLCYIPQHADSRLLQSNLTAPDDGIADFMYAGNLGAGQTVDVIVRATAELGDRNDFRVHIVGDGSRAQALREITAELGIADKITFHGLHTYSDMENFYRTADALLLTLRGNNFVGNTMPGKLQTYMAAGKPVLGAINGAAAQVIAESGCGACVPAGDFKGLAVLMRDYIEHGEKYKSCGAAGKEYFKLNYTIEIFVNRLEKCLENLVSAGKDSDGV